MGGGPGIVQFCALSPQVGALGPDEFLHIGCSRQVRRMVIEAHTRSRVKILRIDGGHSIAVPVILRVLSNRRYGDGTCGGDVHGV